MHTLVKPTRNSVQSHRSERGASMLELAVILPVVLTLVAGLVDVGLKISTVKSVALAARHGARIASSHSRTVIYPPPCGPRIEEICSGESQAQVITSESVTAVARDAACNYLRSTDMDPADWKITVAEPFEISEGGGKFAMATVSISRASSQCWVCYDRFFTSLRPESRSSFVLETECRK